MCGRYGFIPSKNFVEDFEIVNAKEFRWDADYNIAPTTLNPIVTMNSPKKIQLAKWGLLPVWAKDTRVGFSTANARSEEIDTKPSWKSSFQNKRCLVPVSYYFEFAHLKEDPKQKVAYLFKLKGSENFALAGLYSIWKDAEGTGVLTYTIVTTNANKLGAKVHSRMPVILNIKDYDHWANNDHFDPVVLRDILRPYPEEEMESWPVSKEANNSRNNQPKIIKPVAEVPIIPSKPAWEEKVGLENTKPSSS